MLYVIYQLYLNLKKDCCINEIMLYNLSILTLFTQNNSLANHPNYYVCQLCTPFYY